MPNGLHPDTEATLLLCGRFGQQLQDGTEPLQAREFNRLNAWLQDYGLHASDLIHATEQDLRSMEPPVAPSRLMHLLSRGVSLALAMEAWETNGLWVVGRDDEAYPARLKTLVGGAPPLLYGVGRQHLLSVEAPALAIVGSRGVDERGSIFTRHVARACAEDQVTVISGAARGVDREAMDAALEAQGRVVGVLADSLARAAVAGKNRVALLEEQLVLVTPYDPSSGFSVGNAMGRNKLIYALANAGLVVTTDHGVGGTWAGATEALKRGVTPVFVRLEEPIPDGNVALLDEGAKPFPAGPWTDMRGWMNDTATKADDSAARFTQPPLL